METKIKNTLFRFVAFRKPEQINDDKKLNLFVHLPDNIKALSNLYALTQTEFNTKITTFETSTTPKLVKTKDELKVLNQPLYDLAFWVLQNRESVTATSFQTKMDELNVTTASILSEADEVTVWDNFIYQVTQHKDDIAREAAMTLLYGNYLLKQQTLQNGLIANVSTSSFTGTTPPPPNPDALTVKQFRRILQARIVRPDFLAFPPITTTPPASIVGDEPLSLQTQQQFRNALNQLNSKRTIANLEKLKKELVSAAKKYNKLEVQNLKTYDTQYQSDYDDYLASINNSSSSLTGGDATPQVPPPPYDYSSLAQLDATRLESHLSSESFEFYNEIASEDVETFADLNDLITQKISEESTASFRLPSTTTTFWSIGGVTVPYEPTNPTNNYTYVIQPIKKNNSILRYKFNLAIKVPNTQMDIQSISYSVYKDEDLLRTSNNADFNNIDSIIVGELFESGVLLPINTTHVVINANITFNNGAKYSLIQTVVLSEEALGTLEDVSNPNGQQQEEGGSGNPVPPVVILPTDNRPSWKKFGVTRLGIADYRKVEQSICCYVPGEVSHIENIMASEYKERATKRLRRSENTITTESSTETESLTDSTSTERNEMHQEISKMQQQSMDLSVGTSASYSGFGFTFNANAAFAMHNSKEQSNNMARTEARELTERASEKVVRKVREERINKIIDEFTDENKHGFDNRTNKEHVSGVYRWVDKIYKNEIFNYGKRLMYEFMIPEPAKFHLLSNDAIVLSEPYDFVTKDSITDSTKITKGNYLKIAERNNAQIDVWPDESIYLSKELMRDFKSGTDGAPGDGIKHQVAELILPIPEGYQVDSISGFLNLKNGDHPDAFLNKQAYLYIGGISKKLTSVQISGGNTIAAITRMYNEVLFEFPNSAFNGKVITNELSATFTTWDIGSYNLNIIVKCKLTDKAILELQSETYNSLIKDYKDKYAIYQEKLAELKGKKVNPLFYRVIENTVLRKNCISYLLGYDNVGNNFQDGNSLAGHKIKDTAINNSTVRLSDYSSKVKFFEQAFEWEIMSYIFYPFYWAFRDNWTKLYGQETDDILFTKFLESGMARVILTVRPGFEDAVNWFLETGQIWNGQGSPPVIGDDLYLSIVDELQEPEYYVEGSWESRVPSTLTVIQSSGVGLLASGLPCACKQETKEEFTGLNNTLAGVTAEGGVGYWKVNADENQTPPIYVPNPNPTE